MVKKDGSHILDMPMWCHSLGKQIPVLMENTALMNLILYRMCSKLKIQRCQMTLCTVVTMNLPS